METLHSITYGIDGPIARITLNRPQQGNAIDFAMPGEIAACVERANLDPAIHVIALSGNGPGFCGGYDLALTAEGGFQEGGGTGPATPPPGSPLDIGVIRRNHDPTRTWDAMTDYAFMSRNVRAFMSLYESDKPVVCKVHGFCVAGGSDLALCSDLLVVEDTAKIGYPPARVWGVPTTALWVSRVGMQRAKRLLFTGDCLSGREALEWGVAIEAPSSGELEERFETLLMRIARVPVNQLMMHKLLIHQADRDLRGAQVLGTVLDGIARHTREGYAFQQRAMEAGFRTAVKERDEPFGDAGRSTYKG